MPRPTRSGVQIGAEARAAYSRESRASGAVSWMISAVTAKAPAAEKPMMASLRALVKSLYLLWQSGVDLPLSGPPPL